MNPDNFGRAVTFLRVGDFDQYDVTGADGGTFTLSFPTGTSVERVYLTINALAPYTAATEAPPAALDPIVAAAIAAAQNAGT